MVTKGIENRYSALCREIEGESLILECLFVGKSFLCMRDILEGVKILCKANLYQMRVGFKLEGVLTFHLCWSLVRHIAVLQIKNG